MDVTFTQQVPARLISLQDKPVSFQATFSYSAADPLAINVSLPAEATRGRGARMWSFARDLLSEGLEANVDADTGTGDVRIWSCCPSGTVLEFHTAGDIFPVHLGTTVLAKFLQSTHAVVAPGRESVSTALERTLTSLIQGGPVQRE